MRDKKSPGFSCQGRDELRVLGKEIVVNSSEENAQLIPSLSRKPGISRCSSSLKFGESSYFHIIKAYEACFIGVFSSFSDMVLTC